MSDTQCDTHSANYSVISGHFDWSSRMHCRNSSLSPETQKLAWKIVRVLPRVPSYQQAPRALSQTASRLISLSSTLQTENLKCIVLHLGCGICRNNDLWRSFNLLPRRPLKLLTGNTLAILEYLQAHKKVEQCVTWKQTKCPIDVHNTKLVSPL